MQRVVKNGSESLPLWLFLTQGYFHGNAFRSYKTSSSSLFSFTQGNLETSKGDLEVHYTPHNHGNHFLQGQFEPSFRGYRERSMRN